jgi:hypothetical protein
VNSEATNRLNKLFAKHSVSESDRAHWIETAMSDFEKTLKPSYPRDNTMLYSLPIPTSRGYKNKELGIHLGRLKLTPYVTIVKFPPDLSL